MTKQNSLIITSYLKVVHAHSGEAGALKPALQSLALLAGAENATKMWDVLDTAGWVTFTVGGKDSTLDHIVETMAPAASVAYHVTDKFDAKNWETKLNADYKAAAPKPDDSTESAFTPEVAPEVAQA